MQYLPQETQEKINDLKRKLQRIQVTPIPGSLAIKRNGDKPEYYHQTVDERKIHRKYISLDNMDLARQLAQQAYNRSMSALLSWMEKESMSLREIDRAVDLQLLKLCPERRALIHPIQPSLEEKLHEWKIRPYQGLPFRSDDSCLYTNNQERVRSKTEKILSDLFQKEGITYKYECPLLLKDGTTIYPDFTFYDPSAEKEIYWEHHGLIGEGEYMKTTIKKIRSYENNDIELGRQLLVTFEGAGLGVDYGRVERMIRSHLIPLIPPQGIESPQGLK